MCEYVCVCVCACVCECAPYINDLWKRVVSYIGCFNIVIAVFGVCALLSGEAVMTRGKNQNWLCVLLDWCTGIFACCCGLTSVHILSKL